MANEILISASLEFTKDGKEAALAFGPGRFTMTGGDYLEGTLTATVNEVALAIGGVGTEGWIMIKNLSATQAINFGASGQSHNIKCPAGGVALFAIGNAALTYKTTADTAEFQYLLLEE